MGAGGAHRSDDAVLAAAVHHLGVDAECDDDDADPERDAADDAERHLVGAGHQGAVVGGELVSVEHGESGAGERGADVVRAVGADEYETRRVRRTEQCIGRRVRHEDERQHEGVCAGADDTELTAHEFQRVADVEAVTVCHHLTDGDFVVGLRFAAVGDLPRAAGAHRYPSR